MAKRKAKGKSREYIDDSDDPDDTGVSYACRSSICLTIPAVHSGQDQEGKAERESRG